VQTIPKKTAQGMDAYGALSAGRKYVQTMKQKKLAMSFLD